MERCAVVVTRRFARPDGGRRPAAHAQPVGTTRSPGRIGSTIQKSVRHCSPSDSLFHVAAAEGAEAVVTRRPRGALHLALLDGGRGRGHWIGDVGLVDHVVVIDIRTVARGHSAV